MKTNQIMTRRMSSFDVFQRTSDGMFNATALLKQWNDSTGEKKEIKDFFKLKGTKDFIEALVEDQDLHGDNSPYVKSRASRGKNAGTWTHPLLFIKFAMWLSPRFEVQVLKFVHDQLINYRHEAGDDYRGLTDAVQRFKHINYPIMAIGLNKVVFGRHQKDIRNNATSEELKRLVDIQKKLAFACEMGYISSFEQLLEEMRRMAAIKLY